MRSLQVAIVLWALGVCTASEYKKAALPDVTGGAA